MIALSGLQAAAAAAVARPTPNPVANANTEPPMSSSLTNTTYATTTVVAPTTHRSPSTVTGGGTGGTTVQIDPKGNPKQVAPITIDDKAPAEPDVYVMNNITNFTSAANHVSGGHIDPTMPKTVQPNGADWAHGGDESIDNWVGGTITPAQIAVLFMDAKANNWQNDYYTALNPIQATDAKLHGWTPSEWRIWTKWRALVGTPRDPGNTPLGNDGLPIQQPPQQLPPQQKLPPLPLPKTPATSSTTKIAFAAIAALGAWYVLAGCTHPQETPMPSIVKHVMRFPFASPDGNQIRAGALPLDAQYGTGVLLTSLAGNTVGTNEFAFQPELLAQRLSVPLERNDEKLTGISIAGDSAIYDCNLNLGQVSTAGSVHRISPGTPWVGGLEARNDVGISLTRSIPPFPTTSYGIDANTMTLLGTLFYQFPLRLNLWYGTPPVPFTRRAGYGYRARAQLTAGQSVTTLFCVDGRTRVIVELQVTTATSTITVSGIAAIPVANNTPDGLSATLQIAQVVTPPVGALRINVPETFAIGNSQCGPWQFIVVTLSDTAGTGAGFHYLTYQAFDN